MGCWSRSWSLGDKEREVRGQEADVHRAVKVGEGHPALPDLRWRPSSIFLVHFGVLFKNIVKYLKLTILTVFKWTVQWY